MKLIKSNNYAKLVNSGKYYFVQANRETGVFLKLKLEQARNRAAIV